MGRCAEERADPRVRGAAAPVVTVEAAALVLALEALSDELLHDRRRAHSAGLRDRFARVPRDLEPDLVDQLERTDRPAKSSHGAVDRLDRIALGEHREGLAD